MSNRIKPEELQKSLRNYLNSYVEDIQEEVEEATDKVTKKAKEELKEKSPRRKNEREEPYHEGWAVKVQKKGRLKYHKVIWNKTNYQLTHLLEFGHANRDGSRTKAIPHIRPIEQKYKVEFVDLVEEKIRKRSKK